MLGIPPEIQEWLTQHKTHPIALESVDYNNANLYAPADATRIFPSSYLDCHIIGPLDLRQISISAWGH